MPKTEIDYSNTIIYKITCKDAGIKDVYVGHTTNFVQRKYAHKQSCINAKSTNHTCKLYTIIREHGGWKNWTMEIVNFFNCNDHYEARIKEQEYFILLNATLNSIEPMPSGKILTKRKESLKILPNVIETPKVAHKFYCINCNYSTYKKSNYDVHNLSAKHSKNKTFKPNTDSGYVCNCCDRTYNDRAGLWRHKKKCDNINPEKTSNSIYDASNNCVSNKDLVMLLIKEHSELKNMILEEHKSTNQIIRETQNQITEVLNIFAYKK